MRSATLMLLAGALLVAGCQGGLWFDPNDANQVDLVAGDLHATMAIGADAMLTAEEATPEQAANIAEIFELATDYVRDGDVKSLSDAVLLIIDEVGEDEENLAIYMRISNRIISRVDAHLQAMAIADDDETAANVARTLTLAALEGAAEGARDYAAGTLPDEG